MEKNPLRCLVLCGDTAISSRNCLMQVNIANSDHSEINVYVVPHFKGAKEKD